MAKKNGEAPAEAASADSKYLFGKTFNTPTGRLMFPQVAEAKPYKDNKPKWGTGLVVKPSPRLTEIIEEVESIGLKAFGEKWKKNPDLFNKPYMTGEQVIERIQEKGKKVSEKSLALYNGNIWISANANTENRKGQPLEAPNAYLFDGSKLPRRAGNSDDLKVIETTFYPGSYCRLAVTPMSYDASAKSKGVKLILKGIQFHKDGERLGGENIDAIMGETFDDDFEFEDEVSASFASDKADEANI